MTTKRSSRSPTRTTNRASGRRQPGLGRGRAQRAADPARYRALGRRSSTRSPRATSTRSSRSWPRPGRCAAPLAVRSSAADEDGADASFAGQHLTLLNVPSVDDVERGGPGDLVVGELRLRDHLPPACRPLRAPERRCRRAVAARSRRRRGDVHAEPDQPGRRAADRGELGSRRGRRRRPRDPRHLPHRPRRRGARTHTRTQEDRDPCRGRRRHRRGDRRARSSSSSSASTTISSRSSTRSPGRSRRCTDRHATSSGRSRAGSSTCCSAAR